MFILPFLLFSGYAGQLADVYSKRTVLVVTKSLEIVADGARPGRVHGRPPRQLTYVVLFLMALQATFFSPAKYGILPEIAARPRSVARQRRARDEHVRRDRRSARRSAAIMFDALARPALWSSASLVVGVAVLGTATSLRIPRVAAAAPGQALRLESVGRDLGSV